MEDHEVTGGSPIMVVLCCSRRNPRAVCSDKCCRWRFGWLCLGIQRSPCPSTGVTAANEGTGVAQTTASEQKNGYFRFLLLPAGKNDMRTEATGFADPPQHGVGIGIGNEVHLNHRRRPRHWQRQILELSYNGCCIWRE